MENKEFTIGNIFFMNEYETRGLIYEIFHQNFYLQEYLCLGPGSIVIDVGSHVGIFSRFAMYKCEGDATVYSFEPIPASFECLRKNMAHYKGKVHLYNMGIANVSDDCSTEFTIFGHDFTTATYKPNDKLISNYNPLLNYERLLKISKFRDKSLYYKLRFLPFMRNKLIEKNFNQRTIKTKIKCKLISLGDFILSNNLRHIDLVKIDVEGSEFEVLKSIKPEQFSGIKQLSIEVHNINNRVEHITSYLRQYGYIIDVDQNWIYKNLDMNQYMIYAKKPN